MRISISIIHHNDISGEMMQEKRSNCRGDKNHHTHGIGITVILIIKLIQVIFELDTELNMFIPISP
jgi:hypothetical protein